MSVIPPTKKTSVIVDDFISYATLHLSTVSGVINTVSLYPPIGTPGPGIINWTGYTITPAKRGEAGDFDSEEAAVIERDINVEYPASQAAYEAQFENEEDAMANNSQVTESEALNSIKEYNAEVNGDDGVVLGEDPPLGESGSLDFGTGPVSVAGTSGGGGSNEPDKEKPKITGKGDDALFKRCGNGHWPAAKNADGTFKVNSTEKAASKCPNFPRTWYATNNAYLKANCTEIIFPTNTGFGLSGPSLPPPLVPLVPATDTGPVPKSRLPLSPSGGSSPNTTPSSSELLSSDLYSLIEFKASASLT